ncbi:MAG: ABC transporter substrate-binding protein [Acidimicrobiia bacterium]
MAVLSLVAAACGDDDGGATTTTAGATTTTAGATTTTAATGCDDSDPVKAGASLTLSGPAKDIGDLAKEGVDMAVEDINAAGGILGRCLEVLIRDDTGDPTKGAQVAREFVDQEQVDFMVGPFLSSVIGAAIEITAPAGTIHVVNGVLPTAGDATQFPYVFRTEVVSFLQSETFIAFMEATGAKTAGILAVNNALGTSVTDAIKAGIEGKDITIVAEEFHESGAVDLTPQMRTIMDADPDVLFQFNTAGPDVTAAINARNSLGWDVPMLGFSSNANKSITDAFTPEEMANVLGGQAYLLLNRPKGTDGEPVGEKAQAFKVRYKAHRGEDPLTVNIQQASGLYDSFWMIATAINAVGSIDADLVKGYLESNGYDGVKATYEYSAERHDGVGLDDLVFVVAHSFIDGTSESAQ